jgi:DNA polymerase-4
MPFPEGSRRRDGAAEERHILHINITNYMAQIEQKRDPALRGRPFAVGSALLPRATVQGVSETAGREGIRPGMDLREARRLLRDLVIVEPDQALYDSTEREIGRILHRYTPLVESRGGGHCFLDIAGTRLLFGRAEDCTNRIRAEIIEGSGLVPSAALAANKLVSKVGSRVVKPFGFTVVRPGDEAAFLAPQDARLLPGIGEKIAEKLLVLGIDTIGALAELSAADARLLGPMGPALRDRARGIDNREVLPALPERRKLSREARFVSDTNDGAFIKARLLLLADDLGLELREDDMTAGGMALSAVYTDGFRVSAEEKLPSRPFRDRDLYTPALLLLDRLLRRRVRLRSLRCVLFDLAPAETQLDLFLPEGDANRDSLQAAVDRMRRKYGPGALRSCAALVT